MMPETVSLRESLISLPAEQRLAAIASLTEAEAEALLYDWSVWARPSQLPPPGDWRIWLLQSGRGFGKTRTAVEWVRAHIGTYGRWHLIGRTAGDVRDTMIEGESGVLAMSPKWERPEYQPSKRRLTWPNGAVATLFSSDAPDALRGPQCEAFWADEAAAWKFADQTWDNLMFGFRLGRQPRGIVSTTPKPTKLIKRLRARRGVHITTGSTFENIDHLAPEFIAEVIEPYVGTRLGRQELDGELLEDVEGALWGVGRIQETRVDPNDPLPDFTRVVIGIDPGTGTGEDSGETGIIAAARGADGHAYVLSDKSLRGSPDTWARRAIMLYHEHHADRIIAERNQGGEMVESTLRTVDPTVPVELVLASRGKVPRAEPVAALYEQGKVHHVGAFAKLEDQMTTWVPGMDSPDRMDALVWALTKLMLHQVIVVRGGPWDTTFGRRVNPWRA